MTATPDSRDPPAGGDAKDAYICVLELARDQLSHENGELAAKVESQAATIATLRQRCERFVRAWRDYTAEANRIADDERKGIPRSYERMDILADQIDACCAALADEEPPA